MVSCFDCTNAKIWPGCSGGREYPPEPAEAECEILIPLWKLEDDHEQLDYEEALALGRLLTLNELFYEIDESRLPEQCGFFNPVMALDCATCGIPIGVPAHEWTIWDVGWDTAEAVCSEDCKSVADPFHDIFEEIRGGR